MTGKLTLLFNGTKNKDEPSTWVVVYKDMTVSTSVYNFGGLKIPFWEGIPSCSRSHGPPAQQTPAARCRRTVRWGFLEWQDET